MQAEMFGDRACGPGNLDDYYEEISCGAVEFVGNVVGDDGGTACVPGADWQPQLLQQQHDQARRRRRARAEAVAALADDVDFAPYDNDGDGPVDALGIIYAGGGPHDGCAGRAATRRQPVAALGPHREPGSPVTGDGDTVNPYIVNSELTYALTNAWDRSDRLHGHPDDRPVRSRVRALAGPSRPVRHDGSSSGAAAWRWSAMASQYIRTINNADTPGHFDPWSKWLPGVDHSDGLRGGRPVRRVESRSRTPAEVHRFLDNPGGPDDGLRPRGGPARASTSSSRTASRRGSTRSCPAAGSSSGTSTRRRAGNQGAGHSAANAPARRHRRGRRSRRGSTGTGRPRRHR